VTDTAVNAATLKLIEAVLRADESVTPEHRAEILRACSPKALTKPRQVGAKQAAQVLGCHPKTLYRYVQKGLLHTVHFSKRKVRFDLNEVEEFAARGLPDEQ
jgi:excisionase family DNA binding protein